MISASSNRLSALRAFALVAGIVAAPAACTLDLQGKTADGAGGSGATSTSSSGAVTSTGASTSTGTGGSMPVCTPDAKQDCYDGPNGTKGVGLCASGQSICQPDGMSQGPCVGAVKPTFDDCLTAVDEDCDNKMPACTGDPQIGAAPGTTTGDDSVFAVASDADGNIYLGGESDSTGSIGYFPSSGVADLTKLDKTGAVKWTKSYPATGMSSYSVVRGVVVDAAGNVTVVGEYRGTITANGISLNSDAGTVDAFVIKVDSGGAPVWAKSFGKDGNQFGASIAASPTGELFICGYMTGSIDFGGDTLTTVGNFDAFVARLDPATGDPVWGKQFGDDGAQIAWHLAATPDGAVVVTGQYTGNIDFGGGALGDYVAFDDIFLAKLAVSDGNGLWAKRFGDGSSFQEAYSVAADSHSNVVIVGPSRGTVDFGGGPLTAQGGGADAFVAHFAPDGTHQWSSLFGDGSEQVANGVAFDPADNVLVTGVMKGTMTINGVVLKEASGSDSKDTDLFVAKLAGSDGKSGWARRAGDKYDQTPWAITTSAAGEVIVGGTFEGELDFGPPLSPFTASGYDSFWVRLAP